LETFVGKYASDGYPDFAVSLNGLGLQACTVGSLDWSELRHYHYNVFEWHLALFDIWIKVRFLVNDYGEIDTVSIPIETEVENIIFTRKQPELSEEIIAALVGEFDTPFDGVAFTVTAHEGKICIAQTGNPPKEVKPYKLNDELVGFRLRRDRLDFLREKDVIDHMVVKTPDITIEALRK